MHWWCKLMWSTYINYQDLGGETREMESFEHKMKGIGNVEHHKYLNMETKQWMLENTFSMFFVPESIRGNANAIKAISTYVHDICGVVHGWTHTKPDAIELKYFCFCLTSISVKKELIP